MSFSGARRGRTLLALQKRLHYMVGPPGPANRNTLRGARASSRSKSPAVSKWSWGKNADTFCPILADLGPRSRRSNHSIVCEFERARARGRTRSAGATNQMGTSNSEVAAIAPPAPSNMVTCRATHTESVTPSLTSADAPTGLCCHPRPSWRSLFQCYGAHRGGQREQRADFAEPDGRALRMGGAEPRCAADIEWGWRTMPRSPDPACRSNAADHVSSSPKKERKRCETPRVCEKWYAASSSE
eukprot:COSAG02_NODE_20915_length_810_cov_0.912799_1_plen_242_part_10